MALAEWVPNGVRVLDIGTDHALLPIYLLQQGIIEQAIAGDKSSSPLIVANVNKHEALLSDEQLQLIQSDGLTNIAIQSGDVAILAGMGGRLMGEILSVEKSIHLHTILVQPNRDAEHLRSLLSQQGWKIIKEKMIEEKGHFYPTLFVERGEQSLTAREAYLGPVFMRERPKEWSRWLQKQNGVYQRIYDNAGVRMAVEQQERWKWITQELNS